MSTDGGEYQALRDTIRERGTARVWIALAGLIGWAALSLATASLLAYPVAVLAPLLVLAATFEIVFALHVGVERIGRYVQVFFEDADPPLGRWERTAMAYGRSFPQAGPDPLFGTHFAGAALLNLVPAYLTGPTPVEGILVVAAHAAFVIRIWRARRQSAGQRALDLERYQALYAAMHPGSGAGRQPSDAATDRQPS